MCLNLTLVVTVSNKFCLCEYENIPSEIWLTGSPSAKTVPAMARTERMAKRILTMV